MTVSTLAPAARRRAKTMLCEFGLTPASRARVSAATAADVDPLEAWLSS